MLQSWGTALGAVSRRTNLMASIQDFLPRHQVRVFRVCHHRQGHHTQATPDGSRIFRHRRSSACKVKGNLIFNMS